MDGVVNNSVMIVLTLILSKVFRASSDGGSFNANVSAWDVSKVTDMRRSKYSQLTTTVCYINKQCSLDRLTSSMICLHGIRRMQKVDLKVDLKVS